jgi:hypothetical protein
MSQAPVAAILLVVVAMVVLMKTAVAAPPPVSVQQPSEPEPESGAVNKDSTNDQPGILDLLPGITQPQIDSASAIAVGPPSEQATRNAARLLWAIDRLPVTIVDRFSTDGRSIGSNIRFVRDQGRVTRLDAVTVPPDLADVIETDLVYRLDLQTNEGMIRVLASDAPVAWGNQKQQLNEPIEVTGLRVGREGDQVIFARTLRWTPGLRPEGDGESAWPLGWRLLGDRGFNCALLSGLARRSRGPLVADDRDTFYGMLDAADQVAVRADVPAADRIQVADLLRNSRDLIGRWIRIDLETARLNRVIVSDAETRQILGADFYWQIDAFANLDRVRVQLQAVDPGGEDLVFENRFPVSVAMVRLPDWLREKTESQRGARQRVDSMMVSDAVTVDAFFYRLWSYESEFATSRGGRQVAPLLLAARVIDRQPGIVAASREIQYLGWIMAAAVIGSILLTTGALWRVSRKDAQIRASRRAEIRDRPL